MTNVTAEEKQALEEVFLCLQKHHQNERKKALAKTVLSKFLGMMVKGCRQLPLKK